MGKWDALVTRRLPKAGMELIAKECEVRLWEEERPIPREDLTAMAPGVQGIVCLLSDGIDKEVMDSAGEGLKVVSTMAVGFDNIDVEEATRRGIVVGHTPGVLTEATADLAWALMLAAARRMTEGDRMMRQTGFRGWSPTMLLGLDFFGKTLGIVGMGKIGSAVSRRAGGFGMKVIYHNRSRLPEEREWESGAGYVTRDELIQSSDFISLHCPLNKESRHMIGSRELRMMKPSVCLINVARGPVVDESALVDALKNKTVAAAGLDVYEREPELAPGLAELDNVVLAPHLGSATVETRTTMAEMTARNLIAGLKGEVPQWCVNPGAIAS